MKNKIFNSLYGAIVADALGVPVEFTSIEERKEKPVTDMIGYGTYNLPKGSWSDDSSMMLCLAESIGRLNTIDYDDIMKNFSLWFNESKFTPDNNLFDIGGSCRKSIMNYFEGVRAVDCGQKSEYDNGNGSLMRIAPLPFYLFQKYGPNVLNSWEAFEVIHNVSRLTHGHYISLIGCDIYCSVMIEILNGVDKTNLLKEALAKVEEYEKVHIKYCDFYSKYERLTESNFANLKEDEIKSSGYVVDTLEAALWCFLTTDNYHDCVLKAVNLGSDTDTVACVAGSIAGLYYGDIPTDWIESLRNKELIDSIIESFESGLSEIKKIVFKHLCRFSLLGDRLFSGFILYDDGTLTSAIEENKTVSLPLEELPTDFELREFPAKLIERKILSSKKLAENISKIISENKSKIDTFYPRMDHLGTMDGEDNILQFEDKIITGYAILEKHWCEIVKEVPYMFPHADGTESDEYVDKETRNDMIFVRTLFFRIQDIILNEPGFPKKQKEYGGSFWVKEEKMER